MQLHLETDWYLHGLVLGPCVKLSVNLGTRQAECRYRETDRKLHEENMKLTGEYKRITEQFKDLQIKFRHFELVDSKKYEDVWRMKETEVITLVKKVMAADKVLHEQQLGLEWRGPAEQVRSPPHPLLCCCPYVYVNLEFGSRSTFCQQCHSSRVTGRPRKGVPLTYRARLAFRFCGPHTLQRLQRRRRGHNKRAGLQAGTRSTMPPQPDR
jgi:hypothetical protein